MSEHDYQGPPHPGPLRSWPDARYDAVLHLLDRQIVAVDGRLAGKVDDVELTVDVDGSLVATALLVGTPALLPRFGGTLGAWLAQRWQQTGITRADRSEPYVVEMSLVDEVTSEVHVAAPREGLLRRRTPATEGPTRHRLGDLLDMEVRLPPEVPGPGSARVLDVCFAPGKSGTQQVCGLVVGHGRPGATLGYDRKERHGPWVVAAIMRWVMRHSVVVDLGPAVDIDWEAEEIRVGATAKVRPVR